MLFAVPYERREDADLYTLPAAQVGLRVPQELSKRDWYRNGLRRVRPCGKALSPFRRLRSQAAEDCGRLGAMQCLWRTEVARRVLQEQDSENRSRLSMQGLLSRLVKGVAPAQPGQGQGGETFARSAPGAQAELRAQSGARYCHCARVESSEPRAALREQATVRECPAAANQRAHPRQARDEHSVSARTCSARTAASRSPSADPWHEAAPWWFGYPLTRLPSRVSRKASRTAVRSRYVLGELRHCLAHRSYPSDGVLRLDDARRRARRLSLHKPATALGRGQLQQGRAHHLAGGLRPSSSAGRP